MKTTIFAVLVCLVLYSCQEKKPEVYSTSSIAINGFDPVAYFAENKPIKGDAAFTYEWKGANWLFSSKANRDLFVGNPGKYEPQYGGYCAYGCSKGKKATTDPQAWSIVEGKLYLNNSPAVQEKWLKEQKARIELADKYWPEIKGK